MENKNKLRVFYGWTRINKVRKTEAISIIYENRKQTEDKVEKFLKRMQETVYVREQTENEMKDGELSNRIYTEYSIRMNEKEIKGSLFKALEVNSEADKNNVSEKERNIISEKLRAAYMMNHPLYKESSQKTSKSSA